MRATFRCRPVRLAFALFLACAAGGCDASKPSRVQVNGASTTSFSVLVGGEVDVFFQNIGPGNFVVPPTTSSSALAFLDETTPEIDPGGITQLFHFKGISTGTTVITFEHTCGCTPAVGPFSAPYSVTDTVTVY